MRNQYLTSEGDPLRDASHIRHEAEGEARARAKLKRLWQPGDLFHMLFRYPRNPETFQVDRLAGVLKQGLVAPASCPDGSVCSDLHLFVQRHIAGLTTGRPGRYICHSGKDALCGGHTGLRLAIVDR